MTMVTVMVTVTVMVMVLVLVQKCGLLLFASWLLLRLKWSCCWCICLHLWWW
jgi:hypothetical protein